MMAEAVGWDDWAMADTRAENTDDIWHVAVAPDDVKIVSLEQLDDLFRLSLVDAETKVWQTGMREWLPLGEVAGLDEKPAAAPKRSHPKPPRPRSAPPPPRPSSPVAAASFYPEPLAIAPAPVTFRAPIAPSIAPLGSVRPLVVSHSPYAVRRGGGFGRFVLCLALLAGAGITAYRNDVVREAAHSLGREALYARLEQALGGPSFGTLRAVEQSVGAGQASAALTLSNLTTTAPAAPPTGANATTPAALLQPAPTPSTPPARAVGANGEPPVVSLESLAPEKSGAAKSASTPVAMAPPVAKSPAPPSFASAPVAKSAPPVKAEAPVPAPAPKAAPVEKPAPAPVPDKPEADMTPRERLNAAIAKAMQTSPASSKKGVKSSTGLKGNGEYDPLNPKL